MMNIPAQGAKSHHKGDKHQKQVTQAKKEMKISAEAKPGQAL